MASGRKTKINKTEGQWKKELSFDKFRVLRKKETEPAFSGKLLYNKEKGMYVCAACGNELFNSDAKFDSGTGWPSFCEPAYKDSIVLKLDISQGMMRMEATCKKCGSHLGHVFDDGPKPSGKRFCINSAALNFKK